MGNPVTRKRLFISNPLSALTIICRLFQTQARLILPGAVFCCNSHHSLYTEHSSLAVLTSSALENPSGYYVLFQKQKQRKVSARSVSPNVFQNNTYSTRSLKSSISQSGNYESYCVLGCGTVQAGIKQKKFWSGLTSSSGKKIIPMMKATVFTGSHPTIKFSHLM